MEVDGKRQETDVSTKLCEPCLAESNSKPADGFCRDCEEFMCQKCFRDHLKAKSCRNHVLSSLQEESSKRKEETAKCKKHTTEIIKYYCQTHYSVVCGDCLVSDHRKCEAEFIKDKAKTFEESSEFKTFLGQLQTWESDTAESERRIEHNLKKNKTLLDNAIASIRNFRTDIDVWLDNMEKNLETEVRKLSEESIIKMSELEAQIKSLRERIDEIKEELNPKVYTADHLFIRKVECKPKIDNLDKNVFDIKSKNVIKAYLFEPETKVKEMVASLKMGIINVTCEMHTEMKQTLDTDTKHTSGACSSAANIYQLPDPRAAGFDVGKRVEGIEGRYKGCQGIVSRVDPSGFVNVRFFKKGNSAFVERYYAGAAGQYDVKLV